MAETATDLELGQLEEDLPPEALLDYCVYTPVPALDEADGDDPVDAARLRFVDDAMSDAVDASATYVDAAAEAALACSPERVRDPIEVTVVVSLDSEAMELTLDAGQLLTDFIALYAVRGWEGVRSAADQVLAHALRELGRTQAGMSEARREPDSQRTMGSTTSDRSGYGPTAFDVAGAHAEAGRWEAVADRVEAALSLLAGSILDALDRLEQRVDAMAVMRFNLARNAAVEALELYRPRQFSKGTDDFGTTPTIIWGYELESAEQRVALTKVLKPLHELRVRVEDTRVSAANLQRLSIREGDAGPYERERAKLCEQENQLATDLAKAARSEHPFAVAVALAMPRIWSDEAAAKVLYHLLHAVRKEAEAFNADASPIVPGLRSAAAWPQVLRDGPEQALVARLPLDGSRFDPLCAESLIAAVLHELRDGQAPFEAIAVLHYAEALGVASSTAAKAAQARAILMTAASVVLCVASVVAPPLRPVATVLEGALAAHGAIEAMAALARRHGDFQAALQGTMTARDELAWMTELGRVAASTPSELGILDVLLAVGVPLSTIASVLKVVDPQVLAWLDMADTIMDYIGTADTIMGLTGQPDASPAN